MISVRGSLALKGGRSVSHGVLCRVGWVLTRQVVSSAFNLFENSHFSFERMQVFGIILKSLIVRVKFGNVRNDR